MRLAAPELWAGLSALRERVLADEQSVASIRRLFAKLFRRPEPGPVDTAKLMPLTLAVVVVLGGMSLLLIYADIDKPISLFG